MSAHHYLSYTYYLEWTSLGKKYYGVRTANKVHPEKDFWFIYKSSSDVVKEYIQKYGDPDIRRIDQIFDCSKKADYYETKYLIENNAANSDEWLNQNNGTPLHNIPHLEKSKRKISESRKGQKPSIETREKNELSS